MSAKAPNHVSRANKSQQSIAQSAARKEKPRKSNNVDSKKDLRFPSGESWERWWKAVVVIILAHVNKSEALRCSTICKVIYDAK